MRERRNWPAQDLGTDSSALQTNHLQEDKAIQLTEPHRTTPTRKGLVTNSSFIVLPGESVMIRRLIVGLLLAIPLRAGKQARLRAFPVSVDAHSSLGVSLLAAWKTAVAISTRQLLGRGGWEGSPMFGRQRSPSGTAPRISASCERFGLHF